MAEIGKLRFEPDLNCHECEHVLDNGVKITIYIDSSEKSVTLEQLRAAAQRVCDEWPLRHLRLSDTVASELQSSGYTEDDELPVDPDDCVPFSLGVYADRRGKISYSIGFNVAGAHDEDEFTDGGYELNGQPYDLLLGYAD